MESSKISKLKNSASNQFFLLAGPCAIEGETMAMQIAEHICELTEKYDIPFVSGEEIIKFWNDFINNKEI